MRLPKTPDVFLKSGAVLRTLNMKKSLESLIAAIFQITMKMDDFLLLVWSNCQKMKSFIDERNYVFVQKRKNYFLDQKVHNAVESKESESSQNHNFPGFSNGLVAGTSGTAELPEVVGNSPIWMSRASISVLFFHPPLLLDCGIFTDAKNLFPQIYIYISEWNIFHSGMIFRYYLEWFVNCTICYRIRL